VIVRPRSTEPAEEPTLGIDLAKNVVRVHGVDVHGNVVKKRLTRLKVLPFVAQLSPCLIGMEASGSAHYWAREFSQLGHTVKLMPPQFVKPYVQSQKNDPNDAAGICEALGRPRMRGVPMKSVTQQDVQALHRIRERQIKARTALINQIRGLLAEYGIVIPQRASQVRHKLPFVLAEAENGLTATARAWLSALAEELKTLDQRIAATDQQIERAFEADEACQPLAQLPGIGPLIAAALVAAVGDTTAFQNGRQCAVLRIVDRKTDPRSRWLQAVKARRGKHCASVAQANKPHRSPGRCWRRVTIITTLRKHTGACGPGRQRDTAAPGFHQTIARGVMW